MKRDSDNAGKKEEARTKVETRRVEIEFAKGKNESRLGKRQGERRAKKIEKTKHAFEEDGKRKGPFSFAIYLALLGFLNGAMLLTLGRPTNPDTKVAFAAKRGMPLKNNLVAF